MYLEGSFVPSVYFSRNAREQYPKWMHVLALMWLNDVYAPDEEQSSMRFCTRIDPEASSTVTAMEAGFFKLRDAAMAALAMESAALRVSEDVERIIFIYNFCIHIPPALALRYDVLK